jgi:hypothetical protein
VRRFAQLIRQADYGTLFLELFVVVVGILIAFQIEGWAEERRERSLERDYLVRLKADLQAEIREMDGALRNAQARVDAVRFVERIAGDPTLAAAEPNKVPSAVERSTWRSFPEINAFVYRSEELRRQLAQHYQTLDHFARVGLDRAMHEQFDLRTAGILTTDELSAVEMRDWGGEPLVVSSQRAREIAAALANRPDALALLPDIAQSNIFNTKVIGEARQRAERIIEQIDQILTAAPPAPPTS